MAGPVMEGEMEARPTTATLAARPDPSGPAVAGSPEPLLERALLPGVLLLGGSRGCWEPRYADERALALLGCRDGVELAARWEGIQPFLEALRETPESAVEVPAASTGGRRLTVALVRVDRVDRVDRIDRLEAAGDPAASATPPAPPAAAVTGDLGAAGRFEALLVQDAELRAALESDLRAASQMRSLAQVTPAVAHDLRAPINAMVLNLEVLKETLAAGPVAPPPGAGSGGRDPRERQRRYVAVLREELARLHRSLELFLAHISPRGDRLETLDLREPAQDLAALLRPPARKQQAQIELLLPDAPVPVLAQRHQLRQALLHLGLAALTRVPRDGTLEIRLERLPGPAPVPGPSSREAPAQPTSVTPATPQAPASPPAPGSPPAAASPPGTARLRLTATAQPGGSGGGVAGEPAPSPAGMELDPPEPRFTAAGTEARLAVARSIVAALGGSLRAPSGPSAPTAPGADTREPAGPGELRGSPPAFELRFPLRESS
jgi:signal transduction histidine kinase